MSYEEKEETVYALSVNDKKLGSYRKMNSVCDELKNCRIKGNIVCLNWFKHITKGKKDDKPDLVACNLLADILFWYTPTEMRDEQTGRIVEYRQKFKADRLQKTYQSYANLFGLPKSTIKAAFDNLVRLNIIVREFRNIKTEQGLKLNNLMFIEPIMRTVKIISSKSTIPPPQEKLGDPPPEILGDPPQKSLGTNTYITTYITTHKKNNGKSKKRFYPSDSSEYKAAKYCWEKIKVNHPYVEYDEKRIQDAADMFRLLWSHDGRTKVETRQAIDAACDDDFWSRQFQSPLYLRSKDKNKNPHINIFLALRNGKIKEQEDLPRYLRE